MKDAVNRNAILAVLAVMVAYNTLDRVAWILILQEIKLDLSLTDTQIGLLSGIAYSFFYAAMGIPIARWADRGHHVTVIALTTALSGVFVALCGATRSFTQLMLVRVGVAIGDAGCSPAAQSLIAKYFDRADRPRAMAVFLLGSSLSSVIGMPLAGWLNELHGWRVTFLVIGLPGVVLGAMAWLALHEPQREGRVAAFGSGVSQSDFSDREQAFQQTYREVFVTLWSIRTFRHLAYSWSVAVFFTSGILQWKAAFFLRTYGLDTGELGTWFSVISVLGLLGTYCGGTLASRYAANNERLQLKVMARGYLGYVVVGICVYMSTNLYVALGCKALCTVGAAAMSGPLFSMLQTVVPPNMRAMAIALVYFASSLVGMGLGPLAIGVLSDALRPAVGDQSLRYALTASTVGYLWVGWHLWRAGTCVNGDLVRISAEGSAAPRRLATAAPLSAGVSRKTSTQE